MGTQSSSFELRWKEVFFVILPICFCFFFKSWNSGVRAAKMANIYSPPTIVWENLRNLKSLRRPNASKTPCKTTGRIRWILAKLSSWRNSARLLALLGLLELSKQKEHEFETLRKSIKERHNRLKFLR